MKKKRKTAIHKKLSKFSLDEIANEAGLTKHQVVGVKYSRNKNIDMIEKCLLAVRELTIKKEEKLKEVMQLCD